MSYYFSKIPTGIVPKSDYLLKDDIQLRPANKVNYENYFAPGLGVFFDILYFISSSQSMEEHVLKLQKWALFHAFITDFYFLADLLDRGFIQEHQIATDEKAIQEELNEGIHLVDFNHVGNILYNPYDTNAPSSIVTYKSLFEKYELLQQNDLALIYTWLLRIQPAYAQLMSFSLFQGMREYWQIAAYVSILEAIIGHAPYCTDSAKTCSCCNRQNLMPHRSQPEKDWRRAFLEKVILDEEVRKDYLTAINAAYDEIRHKTAHPGILPIPDYVYDTVGTKSYSLEVSIKEFGKDIMALRSLALSIKAATRFLLLNKLFGLTTFPSLPSLNSSKK